MSRASNPPLETASILPGGPQNTPNSLSRETLLDYLVQASKTMRQVELGVGVTAWLSGILVLLLAAVLVDHWLWPMNMVARFGVLALLIAWSAWWVPKKIIPLLVKPIHPEHTARKIESQNPQLKESLISWLQLSTENSAPRGVLAVVGRFAVRNLGGQDSTTIVDSANVVRLSALLFGVFLTSVLYLFVSPKSATTSIARILMPWANIAPAARVRIVDVAPGDTTITQGSILPLTVTVRGMYPGDAVKLRYDFSDGQEIGKRLTLNEEIAGINYRLDFGRSFSGIHQPLRYWIEAGDAVSGPYTVKVQSVPIVAIDRIEFEYPAYMKIRNRTAIKEGTIEAPEGTHIKLFAFANQAMAKSRVEFDPIVNKGVFGGASRILELDTEGTQLNGEWFLQLDEKKTNPTHSSYRVKATNTLGESNVDPVIYKVTVSADLPPSVRLQSDLPARIQVPVNGSQEIEIRASDRYGLMAVHAHALRDQQSIFQESIFESTNGATGEVVRVFQFEPQKYNLRAGDVITFYATGSDNRRKVGSDILEPNEAKSSELAIMIVGTKDKDPRSEATPTTKENVPKTGKQDTSASNNSESDKNKNRPESSKSNTNASNSKQESRPSNESNPFGDNKPKSEVASENPSSKSNDKMQNDKSEKDKKSERDKNSSNKNQAENDNQGSGSDKNSDSSSQSEQQNGNSTNNTKSNNSSSSSKNGSKQGSPSAESSDGSESSVNSSDSDASNSRSSTSRKGASGNSKSGASNDASDSEDSDTPKHAGEIFEAIEKMRQERSRRDPSNGASRSAESASENSDGQTDNVSQGETSSESTKNENGNRSSNSGDKNQKPKADGNKSNSASEQSEADKNNSSNGSPSSSSEASKTGNQKSDSLNSSKSAENDSRNANKTNTSKDMNRSAEKDNPRSKGQPNNSENASSSSNDPGESSSKPSNTNASQETGSKASSQRNDTSKSNTPNKSSDNSSSTNPSPDKSASGNNDSKSNSANSPDTQGASPNDSKPSNSQYQSDKPNDSQSNSAQSKDSQSNSAQSNSSQSKNSSPENKQSGNSNSKSGKPTSNESSSGQPNGDSGNESSTAPSNDASSETSKSGGSQSQNSKGSQQPNSNPNETKNPSKDPSSQKGSAGTKQNNGESGSNSSKENSSQGSSSKSPSSESNSSSSPSDGQSGDSAGQSNGAGKGNNEPSAGGASSGPNRTGGIGSGQSGGKGAGETATHGEAAANKEFADKVTDLALDYLKQQKDQPDPELLKRLNWTKEDMQKFLDHWTKAKELARIDPEKKRELDAELRSLGLRPGVSKERKIQDRDDEIKGYQEEGSRVRAPERLRDQFEQFRRATIKNPN